MDRAELSIDGMRYLSRSLHQRLFFYSLSSFYSVSFISSFLRSAAAMSGSHVAHFDSFLMFLASVPSSFSQLLYKRIYARIILIGDNP